MQTQIHAQLRTKDEQQSNPAAQRPHTEKEIDVQTQSLNSAPMVQIRPRHSPSTRPRDVEAALALARTQHEDWWWLLEIHSNVLVAGAVDLEVAAELVETSPSDFLAGVVCGLVLNN